MRRVDGLHAACGWRSSADAYAAALPQWPSATARLRLRSRSPIVIAAKAARSKIGCWTYCGASRCATGSWQAQASRCPVRSTFAPCT